MSTSTNTVKAKFDSIPSAVEEAFDIAKRSFLQDLTEAEKKDFKSFDSIDAVYNATDELQREQAKSRSLRNLRKIKPFLECLEQYTGVLDTFVQVKPDVLALIWGPIKFMIKVSSTYVKSFDELLEVMSQISNYLPQFGKYTELFDTNKRIHYVLALFYKDVFDFYSIILSFFRLKKWRLFFESLWPRYASKISVVLENIAKHKMLMGSEVTLAEISEANTARARAYEEYERAQKSREQERFDLAKLSLPLQFYDVELYRNLSNSCLNSGKWLDNDPNFQKWTNEESQSCQILWLQGIPGAGKTFLVSAVIERLRKLNKAVLFVFASYKTSLSLSALSILHSIAFQLASQNEIAQSVLSNSSISDSREMSGSIAFMERLLIDLLRLCDSPYIILDGIDELEFSERQILLSTLLNTTDGHTSLKLLVSSRREHDITRLLKQKALSIQLELRNSNEIATYVQHRAKEWHQNNDLDAAMLPRILKALDPISDKSEGMFLYARLVLDSALSQDSLEELEAEARNLPDGLGEAYHRIIERVQSKGTPKEQEKFKTILELLACSKGPLMEHEIDQAIQLKHSSQSVFFGVNKLRRLTQVCGPIVEINEGIVCFVHFTAKEYLLSSQSEFFLDLPTSHSHAAMVCLKYLKLELFDTTLSESKVKDLILHGAYAFHEYAALEWFSHVKDSLSRSNVSARHDLLQTITTFAYSRANESFEAVAYKPSMALKWLEKYEAGWPDACDTLFNYNRIHILQNKGISSSDGEPRIAAHDPLMVLASLLRIRKQFDSILCPSASHSPDCHCADLSGLYGQKLYRCSWIDCRFFRLGFESWPELRNHLRRHERPFKCDVFTCDFSHIGFISEAQLRKHRFVHSSMLEEDSTKASGPTTAYASFENTKDIEILKDLVRSNEEEYISSICPRLEESELQSLLLIAAGRSSASMVALLLRHGAECGRQDLPSKPLIEAVRADNIDAMRILLERGANVKGTFKSQAGYVDLHLLDLALGNSSSEAVRLLLAHGSTAKSRYKSLCAMVTAEDSEEKNFRIIECLKLLFSGSIIEEHNQMFRKIAERSCSITLAAFLLELGVNINTRRGSEGATALYSAARRTSQKAAEFMKFLIEAGADPNIGIRLTLLKDLRGAKHISKWLGVTWDELVESVTDRPIQV